MTLQIYWKDERKEQIITVAGADFDPSGDVWYYLEDPNDRVTINRSDYCWLRVY